MELSTQAAVTVLGTLPEAVFDYATLPSAASEFFRGYGPIAAIRSIELPPGVAAAPDVVRRITMADGSVLDETILVLDRPLRHRYRVTGFKPPVSWLVEWGEGDWHFAPLGEPADELDGAILGAHERHVAPLEGGTSVRWQYRFRLRRAWTAPLAWLLLTLAMRPAMQRALRRIAAHFQA